MSYTFLVVYKTEYNNTFEKNIGQKNRITCTLQLITKLQKIISNLN